jgi:DNA-binding NtrC family response regulator
MQTIWVLMGETGFIEPPFQLVKSYRKDERRGRPAVVPVELGIETFYKVYKTVRPARVASEDQRIEWDPGKFRSKQMRNLFDEARRFAHLNVPVLLLGERGTGKTTLANWIRVHSPYRQETQDEHWPAVACGQYSPETMRAELFGYKRGSFTGATHDREGLLAAANGDTLFLDEVGDVSRDLQRLLIKALEEKLFLPLGEDKPRKSDFRLLTATNLELSELRRRLDPDFLDRIGTVSLRLPPLREIREELRWLWESVYELTSLRSKVCKKRSQLGSDHHQRVVGALTQHPLPGNLRDLFRVAYRILAARSDPHEPLNSADAVEYGLLGIDDELTRVTYDNRLARAVARAFSDSSPLDGLIEQAGRIPAKEIERDLKVFLAEEIRRLAKSKGVPANRLCDVSERTLREWAEPKTGKPAVSRKISSDKL